ncbi:MAG: hypothetical protein IKK93_00540 [Campylobacter sp.]|nr:hypothetical protein [Campylobacter sp.]
MKRITKHGEHKPMSSQLLPYQEGYATGEHKYGLNKDGKELYINDNGEIRAVTDGYLHEEFINYALPCDENGNVVDEDDIESAYQYRRHRGEEQIYGLATAPVVDKSPLYDENGEIWAHRVAIKTRVINTKDHEFQDQTYFVNSFDANYLEVIKNSIEQKGLYVVASRQEMYDKMQELSDNKTLEDGIQFIVQHDELGSDAEDNDSGNYDTNLYVVAIHSYINNDNPDEPGDSEVPPTIEVPVFKAYAQKRVASEDDTTGEVSYETIEYYVQAKYVMHMNYQFHDPILSNEDGNAPETNGLGLYIGIKDETDNTIQLGLNKNTTDDIKIAIEDAHTIDDVVFGEKIANANNVPDAVLNTVQNNASYTNYVKIHNKTLQRDGSIAETYSYIDFNDFILDEGTWDNENN